MNRWVLDGFLGGVGALALSAALAGPGVAEEESRNADAAINLGEIAITGEKITRGLKDTASSVSVVTGGDLENKPGAASVSDAINDVPNILYTGTVGAPVIRGQDTQGPNFGSTAFFGGTIPRATINLDGRYLNFYEYSFGSTSVWDVDDIEVFRGPQTTSQGANSIAGAIVVKTKDPTFTPEGAYQAEIGNHNSRRTSLALSGPLVTDQLAARVAVDYSGRDTFIDYINRNFAKGKTDQNFQSFTARGKLLWTPEAVPDLTAKLSYSFNSTNRPTNESASVPYDDLNNATASMPSWEQRASSVVGDVNYDFGSGLQLFSQTQYTSTHIDRLMEPFTNGTAKIDQNNLSNETRLTFGDAQSTVSGLFGAYLARTTSNDILYIRGVSDFDDTKENIGVFTEGTYRLTDRWKLTAGLRYQRDHVHRTGTSSYARRALNYEETFDAWLPKISLAYDLTEKTAVGAMISRGYNPGGVNLRFVNGQYVTFDPETVWNYEIFGRTSALDDRLGLNANLFFSDYRDSQRLLPDYLNGVLYGSYAVNADRAHAYGLELSADYRPLDNVRIRGGLGLLQTEINSFSSAGGTVYEGKEFSRAPAYMMNLGVDWDIIPKLRLTAEVRHSDGYHSTDENTAAYDVDAHTVANARVSYKAREYLEIYAYANNIFDERVPAYLYDDRSVGGIVANMMAPRMIGVGVKGSF